MVRQGMDEVNGCGVVERQPRRPHKPKTAGSSPAPASTFHPEELRAFGPRAGAAPIAAEAQKRGPTDRLKKPTIQAGTFSLSGVSVLAPIQNAQIDSGLRESPCLG